MISDEVLYGNALTGDWQAVTELVDRYRNALSKFFYRMTRNAQVTDDLVQETFIRLVTYQGKAPDRFKPWAYTVARNLTYDFFRSAAYRWEVDSSLEEDELLSRVAENDVEDAVMLNHDRLDIAHALACLPFLQREVLVLRFYHDFSLEEITRITGTPLGTVKSRLYLALKRLKTELVRKEYPAYVY